MFGQQGKTNRRLYTEQTQSVNLGANPVLIPFNQLRTVGYLRAINLYAQQWTGTFTLGGGTFANISVAQQNQLRQINSINLINQGIAPIYQNISGLDLGFLHYVGNGMHPSQRRREAELGYVAGAPAAGAPAYPMAWPSGLSATPSGLGIASLSQYPYLQLDQTTPALGGGYSMEIPISEYLIFPATAIGAVGNAAIVSDAPIEVGLLFMQSNAQVVSPFISAAALYGPDLTQSVMTVGTGTPTATATGVNYSLEADFYDVAPSAADRPNGFQLGWAITRTAIDRNVANGNVTHVFANAGLLLRAIYVFFDETAPASNRGRLVDVGAMPGQITLESGATVIKRQETVGQNMRRSLINYGIPAPGILVHDLIPGNVVTDALDTSNLVDPRVVITGLLTNVTRMRVIEERALPLTVAA